MIGKIAPKGKGFRGLSDYLLRHGRGHIVAGPMAGRTPRELAREFGALRGLNPKLTKAVAHLMLSPAPGDPHLSDGQWQALAERYVDGMGFGNAPWIAVVHSDTDHQHLHVVACRIDFAGKTVSDANDFRKSEKLVRQLESEFGLIELPRDRIESTKGQDIEKQGDLPMTQQQPLRLVTEQQQAPTDPSPSPAKKRRKGETNARCRARPNCASTPEKLSDKQRRNMTRRLWDADYVPRMKTLFPGEFVRSHPHDGGQTLHFFDGGCISDQGTSIAVAGEMADVLAARRLVALGRERGWPSIQFSGSDAFVEAAMREARRERVSVIPKDAAQEALWERILSEQQGGMSSAVGMSPLPPGAISAEDDLRATLAELHGLEDWPPLSDEPSSKPVPSLIEKLPQFLDLRARLQKRRDGGADENPRETSTKPEARKRPRLPG